VANAGERDIGLDGCTCGYSVFLSLVARMAGCRWRSGVWGKDGMEGSVIDVEADVLAFAENTMR